MPSVRPIWFPALLIVALAPVGTAQETPRVEAAIVGDSQPITPEITTEQLRRILAEGRIPVLDTRSAQEYAIAHIPGSRNLYEKELEQVLAAYPDTTVQLVLYCNGPWCGKSRRLSAELVKRGYTGVRRYQLGLPVWRALGNTVQTDMAGVRYVQDGDRTAHVHAGETHASPLRVRCERHVGKNVSTLTEAPAHESRSRLESEMGLYFKASSCWTPTTRNTTEQTAGTREREPRVPARAST